MDLPSSLVHNVESSLIRVPSLPSSTLVLNDTPTTPGTSSSLQSILTAQQFFSAVFPTENYGAKLFKDGYDDLDVIGSMTDFELSNYIPLKGHRVRLRRRLHRLEAERIEKDKLRKVYRSFTSSQKLEIIEFAQTKGVKPTARLFKVTPCQLRGWMKRRSQLESMDDSDPDAQSSIYPRPEPLKIDTHPFRKILSSPLAEDSGDHHCSSKLASSGLLQPLVDYDEKGYRSFPVAQKLAIIKQAEEEGIKPTARLYKLTPCQLRGWMKRKSVLQVDNAPPDSTAAYSLPDQSSHIYQYSQTPPSGLASLSSRRLLPPPPMHNRFPPTTHVSMQQQQQQHQHQHQHQHQQHQHAHPHTHSHPVAASTMPTMSSHASSFATTSTTLASSMLNVLGQPQPLPHPHHPPAHGSSHSTSSHLPPYASSHSHTYQHANGMSAVYHASITPDSAGPPHTPLYNLHTPSSELVAPEYTHSLPSLVVTDGVLSSGSTDASSSTATTAGGAAGGGSGVAVGAPGPGPGVSELMSSVSASPAGQSGIGHAAMAPQLSDMLHLRMSSSFDSGVSGLGVETTRTASTRSMFSDMLNHSHAMDSQRTPAAPAPGSSRIPSLAAPPDSFARASTDMMFKPQQGVQPTSYEQNESFGLARPYPGEGMSLVHSAHSLSDAFHTPISDPYPHSSSALSDSPASLTLYSRPTYGDTPHSHTHTHAHAHAHSPSGALDSRSALYGRHTEAFLTDTAHAPPPARSVVSVNAAMFLRGHAQQPSDADALPDSALLSRTGGPPAPPAHSHSHSDALPSRAPSGSTSTGMDVDSALPPPPPPPPPPSYAHDTLSMPYSVAHYSPPAVVAALSPHASAPQQHTTTESSSHPHHHAPMHHRAQAAAPLPHLPHTHSPLHDAHAAPPLSSPLADGTLAQSSAAVVLASAPAATTTSSSSTTSSSTTSSSSTTTSSTTATAKLAASSTPAQSSPPAPVPSSRLLLPHCVSAATNAKILSSMQADDKSPLSVQEPSSLDTSPRTTLSAPPGGSLTHAASPSPPPAVVHLSCSAPMPPALPHTSLFTTRSPQRQPQPSPRVPLESLPPPVLPPTHAHAPSASTSTSASGSGSPARRPQCSAPPPCDGHGSPRASRSAHASDAATPARLPPVATLSPSAELEERREFPW